MTITAPNGKTVAQRPQIVYPCVTLFFERDSLLEKLLQMLGPYASLRVLRIGLLGFSCGIPLFLTSSTLAAWLKEIGTPYATIGAFGLVSLPYGLRFFWAPFLDCLSIPYLSNRFGQRRSWLLFSQFILLGALLGFVVVGPSPKIPIMVGLSLCVSIAAATQDILMLAYQLESLPQSHYGAGEATGILGYRLGMILSGAGALYFSSYIPWNFVYGMMGLFVLVGIFTVLGSPSLPLESSKTLSHPSQSIRQYLYRTVVTPLKDFKTQKNWILFLLLMFLFNMGDNLIGHMSNVFYLDMGFSKAEIAQGSKVFGTVMSSLGGLAGGVLIIRLGFLKSLLIFGTLHGISNLMYIAVAHSGNYLPLFYLSIGLEYLTGGMRTTALFAYQLTLCNRKYAAAQLALLTSCFSLGRTCFSALSGGLVNFLGWIPFFYIAVLSSIPGLLIAYILYSREKTTLKIRPNFPQSPSSRSRSDS